MEIGRMQFRLRTLLASMAAVAVLAAFGGHRWHKWRTTRPVFLIEQFNRHVDRQEYERALEIAQTAERLYPDDPIMGYLVKKAEFVLAIQQGNHEHSEFGCGGSFPLAESDRDWWDQLTSKRLAETSSTDSVGERP